MFKTMKKDSFDEALEEIMEDPDPDCSANDLTRLLAEAELNNPYSPNYELGIVPPM